MRKAWETPGLQGGAAPLTVLGSQQKDRDRLKVLKVNMDWESGTSYYSVEKPLIWFSAARLSYLNTQVLAGPSANPTNRRMHNLTRSLMEKLEHWSVLRIERGIFGQRWMPQVPWTPNLTKAHFEKSVPPPLADKAVPGLNSDLRKLPPRRSQSPQTHSHLTLSLDC